MISRLDLSSQCAWLLCCQIASLHLLTGFVPAPILYGAAIESQCLFWQESCEKTGECMQYDRPGLRYVYFGLTGGLQFVAVMCYFLSAYFVFKVNDNPKTLFNPNNITKFPLKLSKKYSWPRIIISICCFCCSTHFFFFFQPQFVCNTGYFLINRKKIHVLITNIVSNWFELS